MLCIFYKLVSEIVINKKMLLNKEKKNKVKENKAKNITKYAEKGAMKHPGIVRNKLFSKVCNMVRERERKERERERENCRLYGTSVFEMLN